MIVRLDGEVIGSQGIFTEGFIALRTVRYGFLAHQGRPGQRLRRRDAGGDLGVRLRVSRRAQSRPAVLRLTTDRSIKVSDRLGYRENGHIPVQFGDEVAEAVRLRLDKADWDALSGRPEVEISGWEPCAPMFEPA